MNTDPAFPEYELFPAICPFCGGDKLVAVTRVIGYYPRVGVVRERDGSRVFCEGAFVPCGDDVWSEDHLLCNSCHEEISSREDERELIAASLAVVKQSHTTG